MNVNRFFAGLDNTTKHVMGGVYTLDEVKQVIRMAEIALIQDADNGELDSMLEMSRHRGSHTTWINLGCCELTSNKRRWSLCVV